MRRRVWVGEVGWSGLLIGTVTMVRYGTAWSKAEGREDSWAAGRLGG